jgi:hypothetical protein
MNQRFQDDHMDEQRSRRLVPDEAPDPVETRDPASQARPRRRSRAWLYAVPALALVVIGVVWMSLTEREREGGQSAPYAVAGTSGTREDDPEGLGRGDETPLNPSATGPSVIGDMELLTAKEKYVGRSVEIRAIPVMSTPGPRTLWVGRPMNRTLILLDRNTQAAGRLAAGQPVRVSGRLEKRPDKAAIDRAGLQEDDREALEGVDVFIRASAVTPQQRTGPADAPTRP